MISNEPNEPKKDYTQENESSKNAIIYEFAKDWGKEPKQLNGFQVFGYIMLIILIIIILL